VKATVYRSSRAEIDLFEIWGFIAKDDPVAAEGDEVFARLRVRD